MILRFYDSSLRSEFILYIPCCVKKSFLTTFGWKRDVWSPLVPNLGGEVKNKMSWEGGHLSSLFSQNLKKKMNSHPETALFWQNTF